MRSLFNRLFVGEQPLVQVAALPVRAGRAGLQIGLITSRRTGRWLIPKGWPQPGLTPSETAAAEALEEAGFEGKIAAEPLGSYDYRKELHLLASTVCRIDVYRLEVTRERFDWEERNERQRAWFDREAAAEQVEEPGLATLIRSVAGSGA